MQQKEKTQPASHERADQAIPDDTRHSAQAPETAVSRLSAAERPILANGAMVRAILAGRKTQTRRAVKGVALDWLNAGFTPDFTAADANGLCPFGQPGDRLWVRETTEADRDTSDAVVLSRYSADGEPVLHPEEADAAFQGSIQHWSYSRDTRPNIHMPREMCRLVLEITDARVERLQAISREDAIAEGAAGGHGSIPGYPYNALPQEHFMVLWTSTGGDWDANPWVWVISFKRVDGGQH